jgi:hypothetical protein
VINVRHQLPIKLGSIIVIGITILLLGLITAFSSFGAWPRIENVYPASESNLDSKYSSLAILVVRDEQSRAPSAYYDTSKIWVSDTNILIRLNGPYGWLRKPILLPKSDVLKCEAIDWDGQNVMNIWLAKKAILVSASDESGALTQWCMNRP